MKDMISLIHLKINTFSSVILLTGFVLGFFGPVNNEVMLSWSVNSGTVPGQA